MTGGILTPTATLNIVEGLWWKPREAGHRRYRVYSLGMTAMIFGI